jgi:hypothetical protein
MKSVFVGLIVILCAGFLSCAPSVSVEKYDGLKAELQAANADLTGARQQLDTVSAKWKTLQSLIELQLILMENFESRYLFRQGKIGQSEYASRATDQWGRINKELSNTNDPELATRFKSAWFSKSDSEEYNQLWAEALDKYIGVTRDYVSDLSGSLNKARNP